MTSLWDIIYTVHVVSETGHQSGVGRGLRSVVPLYNDGHIVHTISSVSLKSKK